MSQDEHYDIHKAAGIIIRNRMLLLCRSYNQDVFVAPGGKLDPGETVTQALIRELKEEVNIDITEADIKPYDTLYAWAATKADKRLRMDTFFVDTDAPITPGNEIEEILWVNTLNKDDHQIGSIFHHDVLPKLKEMDLVD